MALFLLDDATELLGEHTPPCITMIFPTVKAGADTSQNLIRFKNMFRQAQQLLEKQGMRKPKIEKLFEPTMPLFDDIFFWQNQSDSFALFLSEDMFKMYHIPQKLGETLVVNTRFYLKPILPLFFEDSRFYILAISQSRVRLLQGAKAGVHDVDLVGVPRDIDEVVKQFVAERHVEFHMMSSVRSGTRGTPYYHGQGVPTLHSEDKILQYFYQVDKGITRMLGNEHVPLVFAGVEYLFPMYKGVCTYRNLFGDFIRGNPDRISAGQLHKQAIELLEPYFDEVRHEAMEKYHQFAGTGHTTSNSEEVIKSSINGRIETLFIRQGAKVLGKFDEKNGSVELHGERKADTEDLIDVAVRNSFISGGRVYEIPVAEMPGRAEIAAILRY